ncbi:PD-(D/E)XK nuclease family protein [Mahella sp.]|uniref:PD-(D/E)XK nuclease family protein n=1 Tax=Mahella sp. TaxID=2798721 RepID=UPI0025C36091|nr:PD-(D/E)XK nuclease family protein [Mahella sp.]MBZ4665606.1 hypothetical protein [Mahella sp.]
MDSDTFIIFPTRHLVRQYRDKCIRESTAGFAVVNAMTFDDLVDRCMPRVNHMTHIDDMYRRSIVDAIMRKENLSYFKQILPGYVWTVAEDIGELKMAGITPDRFKSLWPVGDAARAADMYHIYDSYEEILRKNLLYDKEDRYILAEQTLSKGLPTFLCSVNEMAFMYFFDATPLQQRIIDAVKKHIPCKVVDGIVRQDDHVAHIKALNISMTGAWDRRTECLWIADKAKELLMAGYKPSDICIVVRDAAAYRETMGWAFRRKGLAAPGESASLLDSPMISSILRWLDSLWDDSVSIDAISDGIYLRQLNLKAMNLSLHDTPDSYAQKLIDTLENSGLRFSIAERGRLGEIEQMAADVKAYEQFVYILQSLVSAQQWSGMTNAVGLDEFCGTLRDMCGRAAYRGSISYDRGPSLLMPSAVRGLTFPVIFMAGMVEGEFPRAIRADWFIKNDERLKAGVMPTSRSLLAQERIFFNLAVQATQRMLFMTYPKVKPDGTPALISSFVEDIKALLHDMPVYDVSVNDMLDMHDDIRQETNESVGYTACGDMQVYIKNKFQNSSFSATAFNEYAMCPYKFFMGRLLGLSAEEDKTRPSALDIGSIYHAVLKEFMQDYVGIGLVPDKREQYVQRLADIAIGHIDASGIKLKYATETLYDVEKQRMVALLATWLDAELALEQRHKGTYKPYRLEQAFGMDGAPPLILSDDLYDIRLIGRIDRIDTAQDGRFIIYDYKKGKSTPDVHDIADGMDFQLPVYIWAAGKMLEHEGYAPAGAAYYSIEGAGLKGMMVKKGSGINTARQKKGVLDDKEWDDMLKQLEQKLFENFDSIMCGLYPKQLQKCPLYDAYNGGFCDFTNICNA